MDISIADYQDYVNYRRAKLREKLEELRRTTKPPYPENAGKRPNEKDVYIFKQEEFRQQARHENTY